MVFVEPKMEILTFDKGDLVASSTGCTREACTLLCVGIACPPTASCNPDCLPEQCPNLT